LCELETGRTLHPLTALHSTSERRVH
jgi:hypothetical protein